MDKSTDSLELKSLMEAVEKEVVEQNCKEKNEKEFRSNVIWSMFFNFLSKPVMRDVSDWLMAYR